MGTKPEILPVGGYFQARANRRSSPEAGWPRSNQRRKPSSYTQCTGTVRVGLTKAADLFSALKDLFLGKLQTVKQLIELKARTVFEQGSFLSFAFTMKDHWLPAERGKGNPLEQQQRLMRCSSPPPHSSS